MSAAAPLTYAERYRTPVPKQPKHSAVEAWLQAGVKELQIAESLVQAGFELAAEAHTEAAQECIKQATALHGQHVDSKKVSKSMGAYSHYLVDADKRRTTSDMILAD